HIDLYHSADVLWVELLQTAFYFNPEISRVRKELYRIHECQADAKVLQAVPAPVYKSVLLETAICPQGMQLARLFNKQELKFRFMMMNKSKSGRWAAWKA